MRLIGLAALAAALLLARPAAAQDEAARLKAAAARVQIVRDDWGIAHVHGRSDADAVFGMVYAQAEDDFNRVETNYLNALGRLAEAEGENAIWSDLRQRLFVDPADLRARYAGSPPWLKALMGGWADGLNYYLATHPQTRPRVLRRFEPWMALSFTEGSIGGDIERVSLDDLKAFYGRPPEVAAARHALRLADARPARFVEPSGSNGIAVAPANTRDGHALLLINPHTSFFFRSELQVTSDEGLTAYGAATWGQPFLYQGFNAHAGWMHTTSGADTVDEFAETVVRRGAGFAYRFGPGERPVGVRRITVPYRLPGGGMGSRTFTVFATRHGPVVRAEGGRWIAEALMNRPVEALSQSFLRTKAADYAGFVKVAARYQANSSNNTVFADDKGEIALLLPQFMPRRDDRFDYTRPVDGADPATDWRGLTPLAELPHLLGPKTGWLFNVNDAPWSAAGPDSPHQDAFPRYMDEAGENPRAIHAAAVLAGRRDFTVEGLRAAAFDSALPAFDRLIPMLAAAYDTLPPADPQRTRLRGEIEALRGWDRRWGVNSTATTLAVAWGERLWERAAKPAKAARVSPWDWMAERIAPAEKLAALAEASDRLRGDFGDWRVKWGDYNRFQRLTGDIVQPFSDAAPSIPVPFGSAQWGSLASFGAKRYPGTKRQYGTSGNSFVAVVEFGPRVRAVAVTAGGESGHAGSPHFDDQAQRYASGDLRPVYFYPDQLAAHVERRYHPGD